MDTRLDFDTARTFPSATIPALAAYGLAVVPGWRAKRDAGRIPTYWRPTPGEPSPYEDPTWRTEHKAWTRRLRDDVRPQVHAAGNAYPDVAANERLLCANDPNYFGAMYGWLLDPQAKADEPMVKPYAKFAYQCHNTTAQYRLIYQEARANLWRPKSRQLGISWDDEHFDTWFYLYGEGAAKLVSRNEKWVYNGKSTESMLGKVLFILTQIEQHTPYLLPEGYTLKQLWQTPNFRDLVLINPITGTVLSGEATTTKVGRGGTYTYGRPDEINFIKDFDEALGSLEWATKHIFGASTESLENGDFAMRAWQAAKIERPESVLEFNWHQNAYLDLEWEREVIAAAMTKEQQERLWREAFRDPFAGFGTWVYPEARTLPDAHRPYRPEEPLDTTIDPAGTGDDMAFLACQPTTSDGQQGFHVLFSFERKLPNPERIAHLLTGILPTPGDACYGWEPDVEERGIMRFYHDAWRHGREMRWFMDPAGDQIHSNTSFWIMLRDKTRALRVRDYERLLAENIARSEHGQPEASLPTPKAIAPRFDIIKKHRLFADREYALRLYLPFVTFQTGVKSAARVREAWGKARYNELSERAVTEPKRRHDESSHLTSCGEYYAIYYRYRHRDPLNTKQLGADLRKLGAPGVPVIPSGFPNRAVIPAALANRHGLRQPPADVPGGWR